MRASFYRFILVASGVLLSLPVWAQAAMDESGVEDASIGMSERLMCQTIWLFQSRIGLILGLAMAIGGLWLIIRGSGLKAGMTLIIGGALLSALPTLATSFMGGLSNFLVQTHLSNIDISGPLMAPQQSVSDCEGNIPVDTSGYTDANLSGAQGQLSGIDPIGGQVAQGAASSGGSSGGGSSGGGSGGRPSVGAASFGGHVNKNAPTGGSGCGQLVDHGIPTSPFDPHRMHPVLHIVRPHNGTDIGCRVGATIHAGGAGTVTFNGWNSSFGNRVVVTTTAGHINTYNHMSSRAGVTVGAAIGQGDPIGPCGATGLVTGPHLHYEVKDNTDTFVDPVANGCQ